MSMMAPKALCADSDIAEGDARGFGPVPAFGRKVIVLRRAGKLHGWLDACPHYEGGTPMAWKNDAYFNGERSHIACHSHGALFDPETGECILGPCLGQRLTRIELKVSDAGEIFVATPQEEMRS